MNFWVREALIITVVAGLISIFLFANCERKKDPKLSQKDIEFARCACEREKRELKWVQRDSHSHISFRCIGDEATYRHYEDTYTEGCSK